MNLYWQVDKRSDASYVTCDNPEIIINVLDTCNKRDTNTQYANRYTREFVGYSWGCSCASYYLFKSKNIQYFVIDSDYQELKDILTAIGFNIIYVKSRAYTYGGFLRATNKIMAKENPQPQQT